MSLAFSQISSRLPNQPVVRVTFNRAPNNADEFKEFLNGLREQTYVHQTPFHQMIITRNMGARILGPKFISVMAEYMRDYETEHIKYLKKTAIVVDSDWISRFLKLVFAIRKPKTNIQVFTRREEATTWLEWDKYIEAAKKNGAQK